MNEWIKVSDKLPEKEQRVLIFSKFGIEFVTFNPHEKCWDDADGDDCYRDLDWATHWMPLPEAPK